MKKKGISGSALKLIAIVTMAIDHAGAGILGRLFWQRGYTGVLGEDSLYTVYFIMREIGRIAFPIFCFLLVEGFQKTRSKGRYALRLGLFALISEIPFDLTFNAKWLEFDYQNVFFTLFIGMCAMVALDFIGGRQWVKAPIWDLALKWGLTILASAGFMWLAEALHTDYGALGVLPIIVLYLLREHKVLRIVGGCLVFLWEITAPLAFLPIAFYNGKRGWNVKYFFYVFYPAHLLILYLICLAMGIQGYRSF